MDRPRKLLIILFVVLAYTGAVKAEGENLMKITCPAFIHNTFMPLKYSCEGDGVSPELIIEGVPTEAKSLALIVDDPDAPAGTWVHWVVFNIPVIGRIEENSLPGKLGVTTSGGREYNSPCPPFGTHRYYFKIYALDILLNLKEGVSKGQLEEAMKGHILDKAELIGLYKKVK